MTCWQAGKPAPLNAGDSQVAKTGDRTQPVEMLKLRTVITPPEAPPGLLQGVRAGGSLPACSTQLWRFLDAPPPPVRRRGSFSLPPSAPPSLPPRSLFPPLFLSLPPYRLPLSLSHQRHTASKQGSSVSRAPPLNTARLWN